ncbi:MAG: Ppx/GppA phosphatase family protein, partial [Solirubrobacteraceae bacterium]
MAEQRTAVIDLGSNSFRLVVFTAADGWWKRTDEIYEAVRIGQGLEASGELGAKPMKRALQAIDVFAHFCRAQGIEAPDIQAVATSAVRDAANQQEFVERVTAETGLDVRVLTREEEAYFGYLAAVNSTTLADGAVLDLGGGSLQLVEVKGRHADNVGSWPLGAVRMTEHFLAEDEGTSKKERKALRAHVEQVLSADASWLPRSGRRIVGIGGTMRNLAAAAQAEAGDPSMGVQGFRIERAALDDLIAKLAAMPASERGDVKGIKVGRADLILAGAIVVQTVMELGGFEAIETTEAGLREGIFFGSYL